MATVYYPNSGKPETIKLNVVGAIPTNDEIASLTSIPFEKKAVSAEEVKDALKWFAVGIAVAIVGWFFGGWVISEFRGPGVLIFGYGTRYVAAPVSILFGVSSLLKVFRSARKKKAFDAMKWVWMTSIIGEDGVGTRFGKPEYAISTLRRIIPSAVSFPEEGIIAYIKQVRDTIAAAADITTVPTRNAQKDWNPTGPIKDLSLKDEVEIAPGVKQLHAILSYKDCLSKSGNNNSTLTMVAADLEIDITQTYICTGGYWFPYEIMSPIQSSLQKRDPSRQENALEAQKKLTPTE